MDNTSLQQEGLTSEGRPPISSDPDWAPVGIDLLGYVARIALQGRIIVGVTVSFLILSVLVAAFIRPYYEAQATFMPPARETSPFSATGGFSPNSLLAVSGIGFSQGAPYLGFLRSRSVEDSVARQMNVQQVYHLKNVEEARRFVSEKTKFDVETNGIVTVSCRDTSAQFAAQLANAYLTALHQLNQRMSATTFAQRTEIYEEEVAQARGALEKAEANLVNTQQRVGILEPSSTAQVVISTEARLNASIQAAEVQLAVLLQSQTENSPEVIRLRSQIGQLRAQLSQQHLSVSGANTHQSQASGTLPQLSVESIRSARAVREREALYEALLRQADVAHLSETDPGPQLQLIDEAIVPLTKAGPPRRLIVTAGTLIGLLLSVLYVSTRNFFSRSYHRFVKRMHQLRQA